MRPGNYMSASVKSCKFIRMSPVMETSELLNFSLKSEEAMKKGGLTNTLKGVLAITVLTKRCI